MAESVVSFSSCAIYLILFSILPHVGTFQLFRIFNMFVAYNVFQMF